MNDPVLVIVIIVILICLARVFMLSIKGQKNTNQQEQQQQNLDEYTIFCPYCAQKLNVPTEFNGQVAECPACNKEFTVSPPPQKNTPPLQEKKYNFSSSEHRVKNMLLPSKPTPDGYSWAMGFVALLKIIGFITIIAGVIGGIQFSVKGFQLLGELGLEQDAMASLGVIAGAIGIAIVGFILSLFWFICAAFLNLFCGMAKDSAYMVTLKEHELNSRDKS